MRATPANLSKSVSTQRSCWAERLCNIYKTRPTEDEDALSRKQLNHKRQELGAQSACSTDTRISLGWKTDPSSYRQAVPPEWDTQYTKASHTAWFNPFSSHLLAEVDLKKQLYSQQDADLVELFGHVKVLLQISFHQRVQHPSINEMILESLGVLRQPDVIQPGFGYPVVIQLRGFRQAE